MLQNKILQGNRDSYILSFLFLLLSTFFFDAVFLSVGRVYLKVISIAIMLFCWYRCPKDKYNYKVLIPLLWCMVFGSALYSNIVHKQPIREVFLTSYFTLGFASFFVFKYLNLNYSNSVKLLKKFSILFCSLYIIQTLIFPLVLFEGALDNLISGGDGSRIRMACSLCAFCLFFYGIGESMGKWSVKKLAYSVLGFLLIVLFGFRSLTVSAIIFTAYLIFIFNKKNVNRFLFYSVIICLISIIILQIPFLSDKIDDMISRQLESDQTFANESYVRYFSLEFYSQFYDSTIERICGGGIPLVSNDERVRITNDYVANVQAAYQIGLFWNDLGIIGLAFMIGFPAMAVITFLVLRTAMRCRDKELYFIKCSLISVYFASIMTSQEIYRSGNFIIIGLLMYIEYRCHFEKEQINNLIYKYTSK